MRLTLPRSFPFLLLRQRASVAPHKLWLFKSPALVSQTLTAQYRSAFFFQRKSTHAFAVDNYSSIRCRCRRRLCCRNESSASSSSTTTITTTTPIVTTTTTTKTTPTLTAITVTTATTTTATPTAPSDLCSMCLYLYTCICWFCRCITAHLIAVADASTASFAFVAAVIVVVCCLSFRSYQVISRWFSVTTYTGLLTFVSLTETK